MKKFIIMFILSMLFVMSLVPINALAASCSNLTKESSCNSVGYCKWSGSACEDYSTTAEDFCTDNDIKRSLKIVGYIVTICKIALPCIIMFVTMLDMYKCVSEGKIDSLKKELTKLLYRLIISFIIFFLPGILENIFELVDRGDSETAYSECSKCVLTPSQCETTDPEYIDDDDDEGGSGNNGGGDDTTEPTANCPSGYTLTGSYCTDSRYTYDASKCGWSNNDHNFLWIGPTMWTSTDCEKVDGSSFNGTCVVSKVYNSDGTEIDSSNYKDQACLVESEESSGGCLVEGTKILLADGSYKNIEDITYDDLLQVINYETGKVSYEYPVWIEKEEKSSEYTLSTFSDGTTLKTVLHHGVFSYDTNEFVDVLDSSKYHNGTSVAKYVNGKLQKVNVTSVKTVKNNVSYYNVITNTYLNVIADDFVTTTYENMFSANEYKLNKDLKWTINRQEVISNENNVYTYDAEDIADILDIMPYYMFKGLRIDELKYLRNTNVVSKEYFEYLKKMVRSLNENQLLENDGKWVVSTSDGYANKVSEGSTYVLPTPNNTDKFTGWLNTTDGKVYQIGDKLTIVSGTHFIAQYK